MKPLTIEQLKALKVGDWVWRVFPNAIGFSTYIQKMENNDDYFHKSRYKEAECRLNYSDYGTKWLAYKNKKQAETKGEIVEVMEYNGYAPYLARDNTCGQPLLVVPISEERNKELKQQGIEDTDLCVFLE